MPVTDVEQPLEGGASRAGVVRSGDTVRRPLHERSPFIHKVFRLLAVASVPGVPRLLGIDDQGREILTYLDGETGHSVDGWNDAQLVAIARLVRHVHDALADPSVAGAAETVCHNDIAPWNLILVDDVPIGLIDFDDVAPGRRVDDVAYVGWVFLGLGAPDDETDLAELRRRIRLLCTAYENDRPFDGSVRTGFVDAVLAQQDRILTFRRERAENADDVETREFNAGRVGEIERAQAWLETNRGVLDPVDRATT